MNREDFERVYLDWVNNFVSVDGYAEHYGLRRDEALALIKLAWTVCDREHPEK